MARNLNGFIFIMCILAGIFIGWSIGDIILDATTEIRTKDLITCRVVLPFFGAVGGFWIGAIFGQNVEDRIKDMQRNRQNHEE